MQLTDHGPTNHPKPESPATRRAAGPAHVAALLLRRPERAHIERALKGRATLSFVDRVDSLTQLVEGGTVTCVLTELRDAEGERTGNTDACFATDYCGFRCVRQPTAEELVKMKSK